MSYSGKDHSHLVSIAVVYARLVFDRTTGLYYRANTFIMSDFYTVREREESITCHYSIIQVKLKFFSFFNSLFKRIYPTGLYVSLPN